MWKDGTVECEWVINFSCRFPEDPSSLIGRVLVQSVCMAMTLPLTIGLIMLLFWNMHLALSNKTTIEHHEGVTAKIKVPIPEHALSPSSRHVLT